MLPDEILQDLHRKVLDHFSQAHPGLIGAVYKLADAGWTWEEIQSLLDGVYAAGKNGTGSDIGPCPNECCY